MSHQMCAYPSAKAGVQGLPLARTGGDRHDLAPWVPAFARMTIGNHLIQFFSFRSRSRAHLARVERVAHRLADKDQQAQHHASTKNAVSPSHGACRLALPWAKSSPSEAEPGGNPKPRRSSDVNGVVEHSG